MVRRFKRGEEEAFDRIFEKYKVPVYSLCYRYTRNEADARDISQEVFIRIYRNLNKFRGQSKLSTWVYRITVNACISFTRGKRPTSPLQEQQVAEATFRERTQMKVAIDRAIHRLPGRQRMAFILRHYGGYTFGEIGEIMGISTGAAKANHHHAVRKLRISLKDWL
ncbi:MAG: sigma-70 family RNA polymerase sigma factor [candidate division WOR-3 bacterium]|nr:MAG: sigma-70 family RNA polymerase sigma factor [candidate division WOR-3 bacterium]